VGLRGPKPTPTAQLAARGSWRADARIAAGEPQAVAGCPECPDWLSGEAKIAWHHLIPLLHRSGILAQQDRNALARYCQVWARWKSCELFLSEHGSVSDGADGSAKEVPQSALALRLGDALTKMEDRFGLTPSARASIGNHLMTKEEPKNDKSRFFG